jgi:hypothetical protein
MSQDTRSTVGFTSIGSIMGGIGFGAVLATLVAILTALGNSFSGSHPHDVPGIEALKAFGPTALFGAAVLAAVFGLVQWAAYGFGASNKVTNGILCFQATLAGFLLGAGIWPWHEGYVIDLVSGTAAKFALEVFALPVYGALVYGLWILLSKFWGLRDEASKGLSSRLALAAGCGVVIPFLAIWVAIALHSFGH